MTSDGWKLVPVEPTRKMLDEGGFYFIQGGGSVSDSDMAQAKRVYRAMLAAAPAAPQTEQKREPLSDDEIGKLAWKQNLWTDHMIEFSFLAFARAVERAHGIGGGGSDAE